MSSVELVPFDPSGDAELLARWLRKPHVSRWWGDPESRLSEVLDRPVGGDDALIAFDGTPVGYVRWQQVSRSELEAAGIVGVPDGAVDVDIAIGEEAFVGRGVGPAALRQVVTRILESGRPPMIIMGTAIENVGALRAFAKAGFRPIHQFDDPEYGSFWLLRHTDGTPGAVGEGAGASPDALV